MFERNTEKHEGRLNGEAKGSWNFSEDEYQGTLNGEKKKVIVTTTDAVENLKETCSDAGKEISTINFAPLIMIIAFLLLGFFFWLGNGCNLL